MSKSLFIFGLLLCLEATCAIPGGWIDVDADDQFVVNAAKEAAKELSQRFNTEYHTKLAQVLKARNRVVAGMYYKLKMVVGLTNCKKSEINVEEVEKCEFQKNEDTYDECKVLIFRDLSGEYEVQEFVCKPISKNNL